MFSFLTTNLYSLLLLNINLKNDIVMRTRGMMHLLFLRGHSRWGVGCLTHPWANVYIFPLLGYFKYS